MKYSSLSAIFCFYYLGANLTVMTGLISSLEDLRTFYNTGETRPYAFRKRQLESLKNCLFKYEKEIESALFSDLKKNTEETYATETGLVLAEINVAIKKLKGWMKPASAR